MEGIDNEINIVPTKEVQEMMEVIDEVEGNDLEGGTRDDGGDLGGGVGDDDDLDTITPKVGMEFPTQDDAYKYYNQYALKMGFGARWSSTSKSRADPNLVISRRFVCSKQGKSLLKKPTVEGEVHQHRQIRVECKAMMKIIRLKSGSWRVSIFVPQHNNHELSTPSKASNHRSHKKVHRQPVVKNLITQLHSEGLTNANIVKVVNSLELDPVHMITSQQVHDHLRVERKNNVGKNCAKVVDHFIGKRDIDPSFYSSIQIDDDRTLRSVFWADRRSQESRHRSVDVDMCDNVGDSGVDRDIFWGIRYKFNKSLELAYKTPNLADELDRFLTSKLVEYDKVPIPEGVDVPSQGPNSQDDPLAPPLSQFSSNFGSEINIRDPTASARTKGRHKLPSRIRYGLEASQEETTKKRKTCGFCGEKGHYRTGCTKAKAHDLACRGQSASGGSQVLPRID